MKYLTWQRRGDKIDVEKMIEVIGFWWGHPGGQVIYHTLVTIYFDPNTQTHFRKETTGYGESAKTEWFEGRV